MPPGTKALLFEPPDQRPSWGPHGIDAWYIGPTMEHYRCFKFYLPETNATRIGATAKFFPHHCKMPKLSSEDAATAAANDLIAALQKPSPALPYLKLGSTHTTALKELATIFNNTSNNRSTIILQSPDQNQYTKHHHNNNNNATVPTTADTLPVPTTKNNNINYETSSPPTIIPFTQEENEYTTARSINLNKNKSTNSYHHKYSTRNRTPTPTTTAKSFTTKTNRQQPTVLRRSARNKPTRTTRILNPPQYAQAALNLLADTINNNNIHQALSVIHPETGKICQYKDLIQDPKTRDLWLEAMCRELGRLADGWNDIDGTNTI